MRAGEGGVAAGAATTIGGATIDGATMGDEAITGEMGGARWLVLPHQRAMASNATPAATTATRSGLGR